MTVEIRMREKADSEKFPYVAIFTRNTYREAWKFADDAQLRLVMIRYGEFLVNCQSKEDGKIEDV